MAQQEGMLTEGLKQGDYNEITLPSGDICRIHKDGKVECKGPDEEAFTPRVEPENGESLPPLDIKF